MVKTKNVLVKDGLINDKDKVVMNGSWEPGLCVVDVVEGDGLKYYCYQEHYWQSGACTASGVL